MAVTSFGVNDALAVKLWAKKLSVEALKETYFARFIGTSATSLIQIKSEFSKGSGDEMSFGLRMQLTGRGVTEGQVLEGNEEALSLYSDKLRINELLHAVRSRSENTIDAQRIPFDLREEGKDGLRDWWAERFDTIFFNQICSYTPVNGDDVYTGFNAITPAARLIRAGGAANDESLTNAVTHKMTLREIDLAKEVGTNASPMMRPVRVKGKDCYVMFIHPSQVTSLRTNSDAGQWLDIQKAAMNGGDVSENPIFSGAIGMYNNVVLHESSRVTQGVHSVTGAPVPNTRRAVLCGAQAVSLGFGQKHTGEQRFKWVEELFDYERELGVSAQCIFGLKKTRYANKDFATVTVPTYAAAAAVATS